MDGGLINANIEEDLEVAEYKDAQYFKNNNGGELIPNAIRCMQDVLKKKEMPRELNVECDMKNNSNYRRIVTVTPYINDNRNNIFRLTDTQYLLI